MQRFKILIVEDEYIERQAYKIALELAGYVVCGSVSSGEEAIEQAEFEKPDIVIMDIALDGEMDGIEAAKHMISSFGIPVIYVTGYWDEDDKMRAGVSKEHEYLVKPIDSSTLVNAIAAALG